MKHTYKLKLLVMFTILIFQLIAAPATAQKKNNSESAKAEYVTGVIHRMAADEIVISDVLYKFSKDIKFLSRKGTKIETRWFKRGDKVKFVINSKNQIRIVRKT